MNELVKETKTLLKSLNAEDRALLLVELNATWCPCCGDEVGDDGECCD